MNQTPPAAEETRFSKDVIDGQLQKIFSDPFFANSDILRKFLEFIVDQTLSGHANWLKEYTIGVNVLNKPADFKPQDNGIVRIHAGRLRRALHNYYDTTGAFDAIQISIPKGRYVPVFADSRSQIIKDDLHNDDYALTDPSSATLSRKPEVIAVLPFQHFRNNAFENSLVDGLGLQLSNALMQFENYSIAAYYTVSDLWKKSLDLSKLASMIEINYIIAGNIQRVENKVRSHIQMIDCNSGIQLCSCMYEGEFTSENIFNLQDEIVKFIIAEITSSGKLISNKSKRKTLVAVA